MSVLTFPVDRALRRRLCTPESLTHPAKMHAGLLLWLVRQYSRPGDTIVDPCYGVGTTGLAALEQRDVIGFEVEPTYLAMARRNAACVATHAGLFAGQITIRAHDAREPWGVTADVVITSPPYGCETYSGGLRRFRDRLARLDMTQYSRRWQQSQTRLTPGVAGHAGFFYGRAPAQIGHLRGARYWTEITRVYAQAAAALRPGGRCILVIKDHIRDGQRVRTADQTVDVCAALGLALVARHQRAITHPGLWQRRRAEAGQPVVAEEDVLVLERMEGVVS